MSFLEIAVFLGFVYLVYRLLVPIQRRLEGRLNKFFRKNTKTNNTKTTTTIDITDYSKKEKPNEGNILGGIDQLENQMVIMPFAFGHPAKQHLVDPVVAAARLPIFQRAGAVIDGQNQERTAPAHPARA